MYMKLFLNGNFLYFKFKKNLGVEVPKMFGVGVEVPKI